MQLKIQFARSGHKHVYDHEVTYIIGLINYLLNKFHVINYSLQPKYPVLVGGTVLKYF